MRVRMTIGPPRPLPGYPTMPASYPIPVRRVRVSPPASFRSHLTTGTLAFGSWFRSSRPTVDFHLQEPRHAWHTMNSGSEDKPPTRHRTPDCSVTPVIAPNQFAYSNDKICAAC